LHKKNFFPIVKKTLALDKFNVMIKIRQGISVRQHANEKQDICQLQAIIRSCPRAGKNEEERVSLVVKIKRMLKRRLGIKAQKRIKEAASWMFEVIDRSRGRAIPLNTTQKIRASQRLEAGDLVRVRLKDEILSTLDRWQALKGCGFLEEMTEYCGTTQRVLKRVERFIDERDYRVKKARGIVLLEGVICSGTATTGRCDRACFFFWREEWLEKLDRAADTKI
jgi:hypothetical protein